MPNAIGGVMLKRTRGETAKQFCDEEEEHHFQSRKANRKEENGKHDRSVSSPSPETLSSSPSAAAAC